MRWFTLVVLCGALGCVAFRSASVVPTAKTLEIGGTEVTLVDARKDIPDPNRRANQLNGEQPLPTTKLDAAIRDAVAGSGTSAMRVEVRIESFTLSAVDPSELQSTYEPLDPFDPQNQTKSTHTDPRTMLAEMMAWILAEFLNMGYHVAKDAGKAHLDPGAGCQIRATVILTRTDGSQTSTVMTGHGHQDNSNGRFWGDALRDATNQALTEFGEKLSGALKPPMETQLP